MMLRDRVDIVFKATPQTIIRGGVPAAVGNGATSTTSDHGTIYFERAQVILGPDVPFDVDEHAIRHDGRVYTANGEVLRRYMHGRPHHVTIPVQRVS